MIERKRLISCLMVLVVLVSLITPIGELINNNISPSKYKNHGEIRNSAAVTNTMDWIANGIFTSADNWTSTKGSLGDPTDVSALISGGYAKYNVLGDTGNFSWKEDPIDGSNWISVVNEDFPQGPTSNFTDSEGLKAYHLYVDVGANQNPSVHWDRNISISDDLSDYKIINASIQVTVNATVDLDVDCPGDTMTGGDEQAFQDQSHDYVRFYALISDLSKNKEYEIAFLQPDDLGAGNPPGNYHNFVNVSLEPVSEEDLIFYLTSVLNDDFHNFTLTLGMRIFTADNDEYFDRDEFHELLINTVNFNFTYERTIDQQTSISWNQNGDNPDATIADLTSIDQAILNFSYNSTSTWTNSSPNSEIKIKINNVPFAETIKLSEVNKTVKYASFDITSLIRINIDNDINLSIEVSLADEFELNQTFTIYIDNVTLDITYTQSLDDIPTNLHLFLDNVNMTDDPVIEVPLGVNINVTVKYMNLTDDHIPGAMIQLEGKVNDTLTKHLSYDQYNASISTSQLGIGVKILTVTAQRNLYETQTFQFSVVVTEREARLQLFLDGQEKNASDTIIAEVDQIVNVTVNFWENNTPTHLPDATVELLGWGLLNETNNQYNITIDTNNLTSGINAFTIFAQLANYTPQSINFFIELTVKTTQYQLFLNDINKTSDLVYNLVIGQNLNIKVNYTYNQTVFITNATVQLVREGVSSNLTENNITEIYSIDTTQFDIGVNILNIIAQKDLYETQNIQFIITVAERGTELQLYLNNAPKNDGDTITVEVGSTLNVAVSFNDSITNTHIPSATVNMSGIGILNVTNNLYSVSINTGNLGIGKSLLTIVAQLTNYQSQTTQFFVNVIERTTNLQLFFDNEDKTSDSIYNLTIGQTLNITVKYTNAQAEHINTASVELIGEGLSLIFARNDTLGQHYLLLNTTALGIGVKLFTIQAQSTDYTIRSISVSITINRIDGVIETETGDPQIEVEVGKDILLQIILNDTIFGGVIKNASVTYSWAYGQGKLIDSNNDGIYEKILPNVPAEIYTITISAFKSDDYDIKSFELTLIVSQPVSKTAADQTWLIYVLFGGIIGLVSVFTLYQTYFKYPPMVRKIRKLRKKIRKGKKSKLILTSKRSEIIENSIREKTQIIELESKTPDKKINKLKEDKEVDDLKEDKAIDDLKEDKAIDDLKEDKEVDDLKEDKEVDDLKEDKDINELKEKD